MRLIDADALKQDVNGVSTHWLNEWSTIGVLAMVDKQPTVDAVQVVRCGECKHRDEKTGWCEDVQDYISNTNWFCAGGERKDGADDGRN